MKKYNLIPVLILVLALLCGCGPAAASGQIAATTLPVYQFTTMLCQGTDLQVQRLVTESVSCLHDYTLQVAQMRTIESAKAVIISGAGLEDFMNDALASADQCIDASAGVELLDFSHAEHEEDHHHEHDPHIWLSPANAKIMASNICTGLAQMYPEHADTFQKNLEALHQKLDDVQAYGQEQLKDLSCRELVTFHDGFSYFAKAFDLTILKSIEEESGSEASADDLTELIGLVQEHKLPAIFTEAQGSTSAAGVISQATGAKVFSLDMGMAGDDYFEALYHNIDTVKEALG